MRFKQHSRVLDVAQVHTNTSIQNIFVNCANLFGNVKIVRYLCSVIVN